MAPNLASRIMNLWVMKPIRSTLGRNLGNPGSHFLGRVFLKKFFVNNNTFVERLAVNKSNIQPSEKVLELGFGPGVGLQKAAEMISKSEGGKVYGVDRSEAMVKAAKERLAQEIDEGCVELFTASIDNMPFNSNYIDKIFHCNCYYFWDDRPKCCSEILRVLKPGGVMTTTVASQALKLVTENGILTKSQVDINKYMEDLRIAGFDEIKMDEVVKGPRKITFWTIQCKAP